MTLAGGVNLVLSPDTLVMLSKLGGLSADGRCRSFDAKGSGFGRGEGCGIVVLKRLSDAVRDGDRVLALVRGSAVNQDGHSDGLTAPNGLSQQEVIRSALEFAKLTPGDVQYVDAHGTGTVLGDPIEVDALSEVFGAGRSKSSPLVIGSVKSNIGHLEGAAGISGLIKTILCIQHRQLAPSLHFQTPNPHIPWEDIPVRVQTKLGPWPEPNKPLIAGVSSFGISGTNAHVVVSEPPATPADAWKEADRLAAEVKLLPVCVSAKTPEALRAYAKRFAEHLSSPLEAPATWRDVAFTSSVRQTHLEHRLVVVGASAAEWSEKLVAFANGETRRGLVVGEANGLNTKVIFVFPGQGSQWLGMGKGLLESSPVFREHIARCEQAFRPHVNWSLREQLTADLMHSRMGDIDVVQPMIFAMQTGLAAVWASLGVVPDAVLGHSMGEVAASFVAGALTLEDAARVICVRSKLLRRVRGRGAMAAVEMSMAETEAELAKYEGKISVAASNGARSTVVSGDATAITALVEDLKKREIFCRLVKVDVASHSSQVDELKEALMKELTSLRPTPPSLRFVSTCVADSKVEPRLDAGYWWSNLREPVRLSQRVEELIGTGHTLFVEVSPHPVLTVGLEESLRAAGVRAPVVASLRREEPESEVIQESLAALHAAGYVVDWKKPFSVPGRVVSLPSYPWQRERYWLPLGTKAKGRSSASKWSLIHSHTVTSDQPGKHVFEMELELGDASYAYLADHVVQGGVWLPGAAYLEMALEGGIAAFEGRAVSVEDVTLSQALILGEGEAVVVQLVLSPEQGGASRFRIASRSAKEKTAGWTEHASGRLVLDREAAVAEPSKLGEHQQRCTREVERIGLYDDFAGMGISYGPAFQGIERGWRGEGEALSKLVPVEKLTEHASGYVVHPSLLDAAFQTVVVAAQQGMGAGRTYVPSTVGRVVVAGQAAPRWAHAKVLLATEDAVECDVSLLDERGGVVAEVKGLRARPLGRAGDKLDDWVFETAWRPSVSNSAESAEGRWLLLADEQGLAGGLRSWLEARGAEVVTVTRGGAFRKHDASHYELDPRDGASMLRLMKEAFGKAGPKSVVSLFGLDTRALSQSALDEEVVLRAQDLTCTSLLHLVQAFAQMGWNDPPRLFVVTRNCQAANGNRDVRFPEQALAWGFVASVLHEMPELRTTLVDLDEAAGVEALAQELAHADDENRVALRGNERLVARLVRHTRLTKASGALRALTVGGDEGYRLDALEPGRIESVALQPTVVPTPGPGQVVIRTRASGLNFRDVLIALGMYPGLGDGRPPMGGECAGVVHAVGAGVETLRAGDAVVAVSVHGFDAYVVASEDLVVKKPSSLSFEEAAALPSVVMTVLYALERVGRLRKGERILIHAATGGVGLAAVQYAKHVGAEIYATAGSEEKRGYLRSLGVEHVYDSRTLAWSDEVKRDTNGRGVDVVLNSLAGDALVKGVSLLAPFGRFLELGKRDIYENSALGLYGIRNNVTVSAVALDQLMVERPAESRALLEETFRLVDEGVLSPLPVECFPVSRAAEAFERLARAGHIGKVVVTAEESVTVRDSARSDQVDSDKTYLVTGGLGGLGLVVAKRLAKLGAKHLALMGRSAPTEHAKVVIGELEEGGAHVHVLRADVGQASALVSALAELARSAPPVAGVVHAAGVLDDATLTSLTASRIGPVLAPKVKGALFLDRFLPNVGLRVYFSSASGILGSGGQSHYAAANAFLDAFAQHIASRSDHALSLAWGAWSEVGLAARGDRLDNVARQGLAMLSPDDGADMFERVLGSTTIQLSPMPIDFRQWRQANPQLAGMPLLREMFAGSSSARTTHNTGLFDRLRDAPSEADRTAVLEEYLRTAIATVLRSSPAAVPRSVPFKQLGFDSLMTVSLKNTLERDLAIPISTSTLFTHPSVDRLAAFVAGKLKPITLSSNEAASPVAPATAEPAKEPAKELDLGTDSLPTLTDMLSDLSKAGYL
ncbi:MAG TPA: type I polyketide synthase [Labilithrix sp.]|nr:type I polyketide synthase [Labilithrix sp.]